MRAQIYLGLLILFMATTVSCSGTTNASDETKVDPVFLELNIKKISASNILTTYKYQDQREREWTEEGETSLGIFNVTAKKDGDRFSGERNDSDGFANIESSVIITIDNNIKPGRITYLQIIDYTSVDNQYTYLSIAEMENIEINANELNGTTINLVRNGQAVCGYLNSFAEDVSFESGINGEIKDFKCNEETKLEIEIIGNSGSQ